MSDSTTIPVVEVFRFTSFPNWVNKAPSKPWNGNEVCIDTRGRVCRNGADFMRADKDKAFPVIAYRPIDRQQP